MLFRGTHFRSAGRLGIFLRFPSIPPAILRGRLHARPSLDSAVSAAFLDGRLKSQMQIGFRESPPGRAVCPPPLSTSARLPAMSEIALPAVAVEAAEAAAPVAGACPTCDARMTREFCAECGQRAPRGRHTLRSIAAHLLADTVNLDRGLLFTFLELFRAPGAMVRRYLRGGTVSYTNPAKYFLVVGAVTTLVYVQSGIAAEVAASVAEGMRAGSNGGIHPRAGSVLDFIASYFTLLLAFTLPTTALASRWVYRRAGLNYAEHLIFNTYAGAQQCVLLVGVVLLGAVLGGDLEVWLQWSILPASIYFAWAASELVGGPRAPAVVRALFVTALSYALFALLSLAAGVLFGTVAAILLRG